MSVHYCWVTYYRNRPFICLLTRLWSYCICIFNAKQLLERREVAWMPVGLVPTHTIKFYFWIAGATTISALNARLGRLPIQSQTIRQVRRRHGKYIQHCPLLTVGVTYIKRFYIIKKKRKFSRRNKHNSDSLKREKIESYELRDRIQPEWRIYFTTTERKK